MSILRIYVAKLRWCRHFPQSKFAILYLPLRTAHFAAGPIVDFATAKMDQNKTSRFCKNGQKWTKTRPADSLDIHQYLANLYLPWPTAHFYPLDIHQYLANLYLPWPTAHFHFLKNISNLQLPWPTIDLSPRSTVKPKLKASLYSTGKARKPPVQTRQTMNACSCSSFERYCLSKSTYKRDSFTIITPSNAAINAAKCS